MVRGSTRFRRIVGAALLLPLGAFALSFAHDLMRCRLTGVVVEACACPDDLQPRGPTVDPQSCCERQSVEALSAGGQADTAAPLRAPLLVVAHFQPTAASRAGRFLAPLIPSDAHGPPLVLVKHSFLI